MKGQISFDFIIALMTALILLQSLTAYSDAFQLNQERINIRLQEKQIIQDAGTILQYSKAFYLGGQSNAQITIAHSIPKIHLGSKTGGQAKNPIECEIQVSQNQIKITVGKSHYPQLLETETIEQSIQNQSGRQINGTITCGQTISIRNNTVTVN